MIGRLARWLIFAAVLSVISSACSAPSLEDPRCSDAQDRLRRFYSLHFDQIETGSKADDESRRFVTDRLMQEIATRPADEYDYFTAGGERFPKAFRVGTCSMRGDRNAEIDVLLLWRSDEKSEQRPIRITMAKANGEWSVDRVAPL